ncbi:hypothetical protein [Streptomyces sp. NBC_00519]|uniref:hypothetical protein n=1 Tax=Streptomyces sp. NBC_00519 TaxID=2975764 RepID=UPI0030DF21DE
MSEPLTLILQGAVIFLYFGGVGAFATTPVDVWRRKFHLLDRLFALHPGAANWWIALFAVGWPGIPIALGLNWLANLTKRGAR